MSFAVQRPDEPSEIESLILMRTPKYEFIFDEHERGVRVSFERHDDYDDDFLRKFEYSESDAIVRIHTTSQKFELDIRRVGADEVKKMNYDQKFQTSGV